jgi:hypothetical protein
MWVSRLAVAAFILAGDVATTDACDVAVAVDVVWVVCRGLAFAFATSLIVQWCGRVDAFEGAVEGKVSWR